MGTLVQGSVLRHLDLSGHSWQGWSTWLEQSKAVTTCCNCVGDVFSRQGWRGVTCLVKSFSRAWGCVRALGWILPVPSAVYPPALAQLGAVREGGAVQAQWDPRSFATSWSRLNRAVWFSWQMRLAGASVPSSRRMPLFFVGVSPVRTMLLISFSLWRGAKKD